MIEYNAVNPQMVSQLFNFMVATVAVVSLIAFAAYRRVWA
jgi:hypothetical protein